MDEYPWTTGVMNVGLNGKRPLPGDSIRDLILQHLGGHQPTTCESYGFRKHVILRIAKKHLDGSPGLKVAHFWFVIVKEKTTKKLKGAVWV